MAAQITKQNIGAETKQSGVVTAVDQATVAAAIFTLLAPRAITLLSNARTMKDGRVIPPRFSPNDCYVAMEEACGKMARVAARKLSASAELRECGLNIALRHIFPDPTAYLCRCIRSVISDAERLERREVPVVSYDQPLAVGDGAITLKDTLTDNTPASHPEELVIEQDERSRFRHTLAAALEAIPAHYREAIKRDMVRAQAREEGQRVTPETDRERQAVCRARTALAGILKRECGEDNPYISLLAQQRSSRVRRKTNTSANWSSERQSGLMERLLNMPWAERAAFAENPNGDVGEAVLNDVTAEGAVPPSPEMRSAMRVMDTYVLADNPTAKSEEAQQLYLKAQSARYSGSLDQAVRYYRAAYELDPAFFASLNEAGIVLMQLGNLRDALKAFVTIVEHRESGTERYVAATNAADIHLTWFDAGRDRERNIVNARYYAKLAMACPTPMRACNLILAYAKDRYYQEAREVLERLLAADTEACPKVKLLKTLFQIRDAQLVAWWSWLEGQLGEGIIQ